jgi:hypothetical protein
MLQLNEIADYDATALHRSARHYQVRTSGFSDPGKIMTTVLEL